MLVSYWDSTKSEIGSCPILLQRWSVLEKDDCRINMQFLLPFYGTPIYCWKLHYEESLSLCRNVCKVRTDAAMLQYVQVLRPCCHFLFFFTLFNLDCFLPLVMLQRSFQEALKCSRYTERGTPASSHHLSWLCMAGMGELSSKEHLQRSLQNPSRLQM